MSRLIEFYGYSDDNFAWSTIGERKYDGSAQDNCATGRPLVWKVTAGDEGLFVWGLYMPKDAPESTPGCWVVGVQPLDEGVPLPDWQMTLTARDYTTVLMMAVPDGAKVEVAK
jgi:hypothetical protein